MAITLGAELPAQVVVHTDRGTHTHRSITTFAADNGITRSMGYTGICWGHFKPAHSSKWGHTRLAHSRR